MERVNVTLTLNLPEDLAAQAQEAGLLSPAEIERWLRSELERQRQLGTFFAKLDRLQALQPPMTPDEITAEIEAYRAEKRGTKPKTTL